MSQGGVSGKIVAGGGVQAASGQQQARQVAILGVSPGGTVNTIYQPGNRPAAQDLCGTGPLLEEAALVLSAEGAPPPLLVPLKQSVAGAVSSVVADPANAGTGAISISVAPHVPIAFKATAGGAIGSMKGRFSVNGGPYGPVVTSADTGGGTWAYLVPGTFCVITFPAGTYTGSETASVGTDGTVASAGSAATPAVVTSGVGPFDFRALGSHNLVVAFNAGGDQNFDITAVAATKAGAAASYNWTGNFTLKVNGGPTQTVTGVGIANAADLAGLINGAIVDAHAVVNGANVDIISDRKGSGASVQIVAVTDSAGACGFTAGTATGTGTVANDGAVTAAELAAILSAITNGTAVASGGALVLTSTTTGAGASAQVKSASTADLPMGGEFATNIVKHGAASGAIAGLTQTSSPVDTYELLVTVAKGGALGAASLRISLDKGFSLAGVFQIPASGVIVVTDGNGNGTGLVLTCSSTFTANDRYTDLALPPSATSSDVNAALTAMMASSSRPRVCDIHVQGLPASASDAFALAQVVDTALAAAFAAGLDWQAFVECPWADSAGVIPGDVVLSGGVPVLDTADTDSVIRTARSGITTNRVALFATTGGIVSPITAIRTRRPFGWGAVQRYAGTDPANSLGRVADGPLNFALGRDEKLAAIQLGDVQINVPTTYDSENGAFLNITAGGFALKNLTLSALYQDAESMRAMNVVSAIVRATGLQVLADRPPSNADNTIAESAARDYDTKFDLAVKRAVGLEAGGAFGNVRQVTSVAVSVLRTSVVGAAPRQLDVTVPFKGLGMISAVSYTISVQGA